MRGRLLILIGLVILLCVIAIVVVLPEMGQDYTISGRPASEATPYYNEAEIVFPPGTTDWKVTGNPSEINIAYYCLINAKWHQCYPVIKK